MCQTNIRQGENRKIEQSFRMPRPLSSTCGEPRSSLQVVIPLSMVHPASSFPPRQHRTGDNLSWLRFDVSAGSLERKTINQ